MWLLFRNFAHPLLPNSLLLPAIVCWLMAFVAVARFPHRLVPAGIAAAGFVALQPAWFAAVFLHASPVGPGLMLLAIAIVWAADVGAYFAGRRFGRIKLAPRVSPGKTWEGVFGGALLALIVAGLGAEWLELPLGNVLPVAACGAIASVVGDLSVSMLKRNLGLKDTGRLLPGHGGVLDRIDGLIAALPFIAIGLQLTGLLD
jgi:phosphatidate cytidylyltransferase